MIGRDELLAIGQYNKPHGVAGELSATLDGGVATIERLTCLVSDMDGIYVPFFVNSCRPKTATTVLLTLDGIDDEQQASGMTGRAIYALKREWHRPQAAALASGEDDYDVDDEEEGYPLDYFIGFALHDSEGREVGTITDVDDSTDNVLFLVTTDGGDELMIPASDDWIVEFDTDARVMVMDLPEGLLNLNNEKSETE